MTPTKCASVIRHKDVRKPLLFTNKLARDGFVQGLVGPGLSLGVSKKNIKGKIKC
jgi:hypothetical protein